MNFCTELGKAQDFHCASKFTTPIPRTNTSGVKIRPLLKKFMIFISLSREHEIGSFL